MKKIYLDYAASTSLDPRVRRVMEPYFREKFGNPSSIHSFGQEAMAAVDTSREVIARACGVGFRDVIFTSSATEASNLALRGIVRSIKYLVSSIKYPRIITTAIEHESILATCRDLENQGVDVVYLPVDKNGVVDLGALKKSLTKSTILVSVAYANNEIGVIQAIVKIAQIVRNWKLKIENSESVYPLFHTDSVQAFQYLNCNLAELGVDLMTISAHKIYGPKGVGALIARDSGFRIHDSGSRIQGLRENVRGRFMNHESYFLNPLVTGGGQEFGLRSGTENVPAIVGFAKAVEIAVAIREKESARVAALRDYFLHRLQRISGCPIINYRAAGRLPNILNIAFPSIPSEEIVVALDRAGVAVSASSACSMRSLEPSHVLKAIGVTEEVLRSSIRFSFGRPTTKKDIDEVLRRIRKITTS